MPAADDSPLNAPGLDGEDDSQLLIPASSATQERGSRTLKSGDTFAVFDPAGDARAVSGNPQGVFHRDTRHLSHYTLTLDGHRPLLLSSTMRDDNAVLTCDLTNPALRDRGDAGHVAQDLLHLRRTRFLWKARVFERLLIHNYDIAPRTVRLRIGYAADFADIFEVRGATRARHGQTHPAVVEADAVTLSYLGLDGQSRQTRLQFEPAPNQIDAGGAVFEVALPANGRQTLFVEIRCDAGYGERSPRRAFFAGFRHARRELRRSTARSAVITTSNEVFNETVRRAVADIQMLVTDTPTGPYPYAGVPWFSTFFGRDALITALETLWLDPAISLGVLRHLAATQATEIDPANDAEPGKILHEMRFGEMAALREVPFGHYYGGVDSTPLFVLLAGAYLERTGDIDTILAIWPNIEAALRWLDTHGDRDGDGFIEYGRRNSDGLINQGWKDSRDSIFHADGTLATGPIALVEVQAYAYGAWQAAAEMARRLSRPEREIAAMTTRAAELRLRFDQDFWDEELGTFVLALDGDKRPCRVRSSNAGHALLTSVAEPARAASVVRTLMLSSSFSGWGIRTIPTTEARYNPMSYHNGSVWPHDNALIAAGMANYGFTTEAARVYRGLFEASTYIDLKRLPELFCGFPRSRSQGPTFYPVACAPQAWAAASTLSMVRACLGIGFDPSNGYVVFDRPRLPSFIDEMTISRLGLGPASVDVTIARAAEEVTVRILSRVGPLRVLTWS